MRIKTCIFFLMPALLLVLLAGCDTTPDESFPVYTQLSMVSPPDTPYEEKVVPDDPQHQVWRPGHWEYNGEEFFWVPGELLNRPTFSASWAQDRWDRRTYGWAFVPGHWE